jgi:probable DNA metabolism protein
MYAITIPRDAAEAEFRDAARSALAADVPPDRLAFVAPDEPSLLPPLPEGKAKGGSVTVPRAYADLLQDAICHRAEDRFALLYDVLWRVTHGERDLLTRATDPAIARLNDYAHNVRRDIHKMHAFLRFRAHSVDGETLYIAWFEPQHHTLKRAVPFFVDRFSNMTWMIGTPIGTALWQNGTLSYGPPAARPPATGDDVLDELWLIYYRTTFNPARTRVQAMVKEMPKHYWRNMPETALIPDMVAHAAPRVSGMHERAADEPPLFAERIAARGRGVAEVPHTPIAALRADASACRRCPLYGPAKQTVFGEGPDDARLVFVGEQPGDQEDIAGRPFVGPAGEIFDRALAQAGIARDTVYVTNAVKHFKYVPRGKRRIHSKPSGYEIEQCRWWVERELAAISPLLVVALGGTAARSLAGRAVSVLRERGPVQFGAQPGFITVHPSFLLRLPDDGSKTREYQKFVDDLRSVRNLVATASIAA